MAWDDIDWSSLFGDSGGGYVDPGYFDYGSYDPYAGIDWNAINLEDPSVWDQYGLQPEDFIGGGEAPVGDTGGSGYTGTEAPAFDWSQYGFNEADPYGTGTQEYPTTLTNDQLQTLWDAGMRDFSGMDLTDEQMAAMRDAGLTDEQMSGAGGDSRSFWDKVTQGFSGLLGGLGGFAGKAGGAALDAAKNNPLAALALLAGGGAGLAAALQPSAKAIKPPDFGGNIPLSPEQSQLYQYIKNQAGREGMLNEAALPTQLGILGNIQNQLPGLNAQAGAEQGARDLALQNITNGLQNPADPNRRNPDYEPLYQNALAAEGLINQELSNPGEASLFAQRQATELRNKYEQQQREALGTGYSTSTPYVEGRYGAGGVEEGLNEYLQKDMEQGRANRLGMYSNVSLPRIGQSEQGTGNLYGRTLAGQQQQMQNYQGLNQTQDALGKLAATAQATVPQGSAERGLSALTGIKDQQSQLLNSIYQFNANLQNQKNQNLWNFAGTALGGGLYGLSKKA